MTDIFKRFLWFLAAAVIGCSSQPAVQAPTLEHMLELASQGRLKEAVDEAGKLLTELPPGPESKRVVIELGCVRADQGDARGAIRDLQGVGKGLSPRGKLCLGRAYALLAEHGPALDLLQPLVDSGDFDPETARLVVRAAFAMHQPDTAHRLAQIAVAKYPSEATLIAQLARAQAVSGSPVEALETLQEAERVDRESPELPFTRANILWAVDKLDEAIAAYRLALKLSPQFAEAARNLGVALIQSGHYADAATVLLDAHKMTPMDVQVMNNLGVAYASQGKLESAEATYEKALDSAPGDGRLLNNLVDVYIRQGKVDEAIDSLDKLMASEPNRTTPQLRRQDLTALRGILDSLCSDEKPMEVAAAKLMEAGWTEEETVEVLKRVLADPVFGRIIAVRERECTK